MIINEIIRLNKDLAKSNNFMRLSNQDIINILEKDLKYGRQKTEIHYGGDPFFPFLSLGAKRSTENNTYLHFTRKDRLQKGLYHDSMLFFECSRNSIKDCIDNFHATNKSFISSQAEIWGETFAHYVLRLINEGFPYQGPSFKGYVLQHKKSLKTL